MPAQEETSYEEVDETAQEEETPLPGPGRAGRARDEEEAGVEEERPAGRSRREETEADASEVQEYKLARQKKNYYLIIIIELILTAVMAAAMLPIFGYTAKPLYVPATAVIAAIWVMFFVMALTSVLFRLSRIRLTGHRFDRLEMVDRFMARAGVAAVFALILLAIFGSLLAPAPNWLEQSLTHEVTRTLDSNTNYLAYKFTGNDPGGLSFLSLTMQVKNKESVDVYLLKKADFDKLADPKANATKILATSSLDFRRGTTSALYDPDKTANLTYEEYILYVSYEGNGTASLYFSSQRTLNRAFPATLTGISALFMGLAVFWYMMLRGIRQQEMATPARRPSPGAARRLPPIAPGPKETGYESVGEGEEAVERPPPAPMPPPAPSGTSTKIVCPQCRTRFDVVRLEGATKVVCPVCGKSGIIKGTGRKEEAPAAGGVAAAEAATAKPASVKVADLTVSGIAISGGAAPASARSSKAAPDEWEKLLGIPSRPKADTGPVQSARYGGLFDDGAAQPKEKQPAYSKTIKCPRCKNTFMVFDPKRPLDISCPHCGKKGTLK